MGDLIIWIQKNQLLAAVIALILAFAVYTQFLSGPKDFNDCILKVVQEAKTKGSSNMGFYACQRMFPDKPLSPFVPELFGVPSK